MKMNEEEKLYLEMKQVIEKDHEALLSDLKEKALYVEINKRKEFENQLLRLAQEITDFDRRNAVYEVLVSLQTIWNRFQPGKGLQEKFRAAFEKGNYKEAEENYKKLARQGLDYIGTFQTGEGEIIPLVTEEDYMLLQYNKKELTFYTLQFEQLAKIPMPESLAIIDVFAPYTRQSTECKGTGNIEDSMGKIWILFEDKDGKKAVVSTDIKDINSIEIDFHALEHQAAYLDETLTDANLLSCFKNHLLLVSKKSIFYQREDGGWEKWYTWDRIGNEITVFEPTREGFWVGHANGEVIILKKLEYVGVRAAFKGFSQAIKSIRGTGRYVLVSSENCLRIADHTAKPVLEPFETRCKIMQGAILNDDLFIMLLANGMLIARELNQGNICWQINLENIYEMLFTFRQYVFCGNSGGEMMGFEIPAFQTMAKELESKNIYVEKHSFDVEPNAPVRYISDFIGRINILNEIKEVPNAHFLLYGGPRVGKTSLLNVLRDTLSEKARCCIVDAGQLLKDADAYETFELSFIKKCLGQHFIKHSDLPKKSGYHALRAMVNKIKGTRKFCVIGMDNFCVPTHFDKNNTKEFRTFLGSMFILPSLRFIITCSSRENNDIQVFFKDFKELNQRKLISREIPLFSEREVKNALRKKISLKQSIVDEIYKYTGGFPHLIHLYDKWQHGRHSIKEQSELIAKNCSDKIFEYFRDLSLDARLLIATCLYENLAAEKISYTTFYEKFPFLKNSLPKDQLEDAIEEIAGYGSGLSAQKEAEAFKISLSDNARLFSESSKHISWLKDFKKLYDFTSLPDQKRAHQVAHTFTRITQSALDINEYLEQKIEKHRDKFYVSKLNEQGLQALRMPLTTFVVISLKPWRKEVHMEAFLDLNIEFQEFNRNIREAKIFYILLFELHGVPNETVKKDLEGLERISIIDAAMMKNIILAESPQDKATEYIFDQLSIKERSPYTTAGAVPDNLFFGRQMEIALIRGLPENIGIFGTRTIGKTSLLRKLHKAFQPQKQWKVYDMDCSRIESEESLLKNLAEKMGVDFELISDMEKFRRYVTGEAEAGEHRYLFLLDEVDRLVHYDIRHDEKIFNTFNRLCNETMKNSESAARFILFGFQEMFEQMKNPLSRLYNFMVFLPLKSLDMEDSMSLVTGPIENIRVRWKNKEDALYLVDSCSRHPRLLQAACHALLSNLDDKEKRKDIIERADVDKALTSHAFREICMRLYRDHGEDIDADDEKKKVEKKRTLFARIRSKDTRVMNNENSTKKEFLGDLHRITILAAIRLLFQEGKEIFSIMDIQNELKSYKIDVSPNIMRNILDQLCLSGNFRLRDEATIIAAEGSKVRKEAEQINVDDIDLNHFNLSVDHPDVYGENEATFPKFTYEFGVRIFPKLLVGHFGGPKQCEEERKKLIEKGDWKEWIRRY